MPSFRFQPPLQALTKKKSLLTDISITIDTLMSVPQSLVMKYRCTPCMHISPACMYAFLVCTSRFYVCVYKFYVNPEDHMYVPLLCTSRRYVQGMYPFVNLALYVPRSPKHKLFYVQHFQAPRIIVFELKSMVVWSHLGGPKA